MTNSPFKKTHEQFLAEVKHLEIELLDQYINTDTKIRYRCKHGINIAFPWQLRKAKHCCRKGYYETGDMWRSHIVSLEERKKEILSHYDFVYVGDIEVDNTKIYNLKCTRHNIIYDQYISSMQKGLNGCCECKKETKSRIARENLINTRFGKHFGSYVSKSETKWLNEIGIKDRQVWLKDIQYRVDGYDKLTRTVYLYHGRFWHGCPITYDPEEIHPIVGLKMKELYEKTLEWEKKICDAGYNLVVKWGT